MKVHASLHRSGRPVAFRHIEVEIEKLQPGDGIIFCHAPPGDFHDCIGRLDVSL